MDTLRFTPNRFAALLLRWSGLSLGVVLVLLTATGCNDTVSLSNTSGNENGLLVDAQSGGSQANDLTFTNNSANINVGSLTAASGSNEVTAFTNRRPVAIETPVTWTSGSDNIPAPFSNEIAIPVRVWIVKGPFAAQRQKAIDACITTVSIWQSERMGVAFSPFQIVDATSDPDAANYFDFTCAKRTGIENDIGKVNGRINIYYVDTVDGGTGRGQACQIGSDFVAMGRNTGDELLSHELGHDFSLNHIDDLAADFNQTNVMHSASNTREFHTEGQLFRAHLRTNSALNFIYNARSGQPTRNCARNTANDQCPNIRKRIWADGTFPAN